MFRKKIRDLRKLKKTTKMEVPIGLSNSTNVIITLRNVPTYKFHRFQRKLVCLSDIEKELKEIGIDPEIEDTFTLDELKRILINHSAFRKVKNKRRIKSAGNKDMVKEQMEF